MQHGDVHQGNIAQATIKLKAKVTEETTKILAELEKLSTTDVANTIHYSIPCTSYDESGTDAKCHYNVKLSKVIANRNLRSDQKRIMDPNL